MVTVIIMVLIINILIFLISLLSLIGHETERKTEESSEEKTVPELKVNISIATAALLNKVWYRIYQVDQEPFYVEMPWIEFNEKIHELEEEGRKQGIWK